jgi:hypothetical protein
MDEQATAERLGPRHSDEVEFVYSIEGENELNLFELVPILSALGELIQEGNHVLTPEAGEIEIAVKPFEKGSFTIGMLLTMGAATLYTAYQANPLDTIKCILSTVGLIATTGKKFISLLELLKRLNGQPPVEIRPIEPGKVYEVRGQNNQAFEINGGVQNLYQNCIFPNNLTVIYGDALDSPKRQKVKSFIKGEEDSAVEITKEYATALRDIPAPPVDEITEQGAEHTDIVFLNPKRGSFDGEGDKWSFRKGGKQGEVIKANIKDQLFLEKLGSGEYRLNGGDVLKVQLHEKQKVRGNQIRTTNDILRVLEYKPAPNSPKQTTIQF